MPPGPDARGPFSGTVSFQDVADRIEAVDLGDDPAAMRAAFARLVLGDRLVRVAPPVPFAPPGAARIVWFHGGGYVFGSPVTHGRAAAALAAMTEAPVSLPRYRLAPEHPWPAAFEDGLAAARDAQDRGGRVALVGDSAGGHLALVVALALAREGRPVDALALFSPNTDRTGLSDTREANTPRDPMNADADDRALARLAFGDRPDDDPQVSPVLDDLALLPPTHVEVGGREVLLGDARVLVRRGRAAGAEITLHEDPDAFHMWQLWTPWLPAADASLGRAAAFLRRHLSLGA